MKLSDLFLSYASYEISSKNAEEIIEKLRRIIPVRRARILNRSLLKITCFYKHRNIVEGVASECGANVEKVTYSGIGYLLNKHRHRTGLIVGIFLSVLLLFVSSRFVWHISVEGNENISSEEIVQTLKKSGFRVGAYKKNVDIDSVINNFLLNERRISYIALNFDGMIARVQISEAVIAKKQTKKENINLVASSDGIIIRADGYSGQTLVQSGQVVHKGQLLISAFTEGKNGKVYLTGAKGDVWAKTVRTYGVLVPLKKSVKAYTGKEQKSFSVSLLDKNIKMPSLFDKSFDYAQTTVNLTPLEFPFGIKLPAKLVTKTKKQYTIVEEAVGKEQAKSKAYKAAVMRLEEESNGAKTVSVKKEVSETDGYLYCVYSFECVENIAKELEFELS